MTKGIVSLIQWVSIVISITTTAAVGLGETCQSLDECTTPNATCIETVCGCLPSYAAVNDECRPSECGQLEPVLNGRVNLTFDAVSQTFVAEYYCNPNFELIGDATRNCTPPDFQGDPPTCNQITSCSPLPALSYGQIDYTTDSPISVGTIATFTCNLGYQLNGTASITCLDTGKFEDYSTTCDDIDECSPTGTNNCDSNATCTNTPGSFVCACNTGFSGDGSDCQDIDECSPIGTNNCDSNATCTNTPGSFVCACNAGFSGDGFDCQDINECDVAGVNNCDGNASCQNIPGSYICTCLPGFNGDGTVCIVDVPVTCKPQFTKNVYMELSPSLDEKRICLPKESTTPEDICHNAGETIVFQYDGKAFTIFENNTIFCVTYDGDPIPLICDTITAFDDDVNSVSSTTELCFLFNTEPMFVGPSSLSFNVPDMGLQRVVTLSGSDSDSHQTVRIFFIGIEPATLQGSFTIQDNNLTVINPSTLIQEATQAIVSIQVRDSGMPSLMIDANITVQFTFAQISCSASSDPFLVHLNPTPPSPSQIGRIECTDVTQEQGLTFAVQSIQGPFTINQNGEIFYNASASTESSGVFTAVVTARVEQPTITTTEVTVNLIADDFTPFCTALGTGISQFDERDVAGTCYVAVYSCNETAGLQATCTGESDLFNVTCENVNPTVVKVCAKVDLINGYGTYTVSSNVTNQYGSTSLTLSVAVANVNDPPTIQANASSSYDLSEKATVGEQVATFDVSDPDVGYTPPVETLSVALSYTDDSVEPLPFTVSLNSDQNQIIMNVNGTLNFVTKSSYSLRLTVSDSAGLSDFILLTINLENINEEPSCNPGIIDTSASVQTPAGTPITTLQCSDPDLDALTYSLDGASNIISYFEVNTTGVVYIKNQLVDFTADDTVLEFQVIVADAGGLQTAVNFSVSISNTVPPQCDVSTYTTSKSEKTGAAICFTVPTDCRDPVQNEALIFEFQTGNGTQLFRLDENGNQNNDIQMCTSVDLQDNYGTWLINIGVKSSFGERDIQLIISVIDQNDPPVFSDQSLTVPVTENVPVGTLVTRVTASDPDSGLSGKVTYRSMSNDGTGLEESTLFSLDGTTGDISVKSAIDADRSDIQESYTFTITAIDGNIQEPKSAQSTLTITIEDVNDNPPVCSMSTDNITVLLTLSVGQPVYNLNCVDNDRSPVYRQLQYTIVSDDVSSMFSVNDSGTVLLSAALSRDVVLYKIPILVSDKDKIDNTSFTDTVEITVNVDTAIPPSCTPNQITKTFQETLPQGSCLDVEVKCTDPTGGTLNVQSAYGSGAGLLEIRRATTQSFLGINACTNTSLRAQFGTYELVGVISNGLATTSIRWTFTVTNVNDPPKFVPPVYNVDVSETVSPSTEILTLNATDPDDTTANQTFHLQGVTVNLTNNADFDDALSEVFLYVGQGVRTFYSTGVLNATKRNLYQYLATAVDVMGLSATAMVNIHIEDVNSAPICDPATFSQSITILAEPGTVVQTLSCYDTDIDPQNVYLDYEIVSGDPDGYFNVSEMGAVEVKKDLPRTRLYNDRRASLMISVTDRGIPSQSTNVVVDILVDNRIPVTCSPVVTPPDIWVVNECATVTTDCQDPTIQGTSHLVYTLDGNYTQGFREQDNGEQGTFVLCYKNVTSADFELIIQVDNSLSIYSKTVYIKVAYEQATPVFNASKYEAEITELTEVNTQVLTVRATSQKQIGSLVYRVLDADSFEGWNTSFNLDTSTGVITTIAPLMNLADQLVTLRIEAEDTGSRLKSATQVEIKVVDINEAPSCVFTSETLDIDVDINTGTTIVEFSCTDTDTKPEYKQMQFTLTGSIDYFSLDDPSAPSAIYINQPMDVTTPSYEFQLTVSDRAETPLTFQKTFQITVSLLPPPLIVEAVALKYNLIRVNWRYERQAYASVTNSYKVLLKRPNNPEISSGDLAVTLKNFNMTQLTEKTTYTVLVMAVTRYGITNSTDVVITTPEIPKLTNFTATIRIPNIDYSPDLRQDSQYFQRTKQTVLSVLTDTLATSPGFAGVDLRGFREANSIYADFIVFVNQTGTASNTINFLNSSVASGWLDTQAVDSGYFIAAEGDGYILIDAIRQTPSVLTNGVQATLTCDIIRIGYSSSTEFDFWWTYNGNRISPTSQSSYALERIFFEGFPELAQSKLIINPLMERHNGNYKCMASVKDRDPVTEKATTIAVISKPIVIMLPISQSVSLGGDVLIACQLVFPLPNFREFVWYRNGEPMELMQGETIDRSDENNLTLTITGIRNSTVFSCEGVNDAGPGERAYSSVGVTPLVVTETSQCGNDTDNQGYMWENTPSSSTTIGQCPQGYKGSVTRDCSSEGVWENPYYNCVKDSFVTISNEVNAILDGSSTSNISDVLDRLASETTGLDLLNGDINTILESLTSVNLIIEEAVVTGETAIAETFDVLQIASNLIAERNTQTWKTKIKQENAGAIAVPKVVDDFLKAVSGVIGITDDNPLSVTKDYLYTEVGKDTRTQQGPCTFPDRTGVLPEWVKDQGTGIVIPSHPLGHTFAGSFFRGITLILVTNLKRNGAIEDVSHIMDINSDIVSFSIKEQVGSLAVPARIIFEHFYTNYSNPICVYWDFAESAFLTDGCYLVSSTDVQTICECNHLTNFAVLMSPGKTPKADVMALSIISAVGCAISILCLIITIILHLIVWRLVKSDRAILLMNLCVALIISYIVFLVGIDQAESEDICTAISVMLHFFYLVVFFLMLAYGIEIGVSVIYVFVTRSRIRWLLPLAWLIPAVIVGISAAITKLDGYGNEEFCWLSTDSGLLWAFVGPAAFVILINLIIVIAVFRKMFKSSVMMTKSDREKAKTGVRSICVLLPILGLTWVFGIFSVNEEMVAFQYIFTVCNSLQGLFILLFHCLFNNQLRDALKHRSVRKKSVATFENSYKNQHSMSTSTSFHSDKTSKQTNKELEIPNTSTNPFLEADRQMKEMVAKNKKGGNLNDNLTNNKVEKGPPTHSVDIDDVKISNILRESEVMGGTAGISSILHTQTNENDVGREEIKHGEDSSGGRTPGTGNTSYSGSNSRLDYQQPKPEGYEKLLQQQPAKQYGGYEQLKQPYNQPPARSFDDVDAEIERIREWEREKEREKERKRIMEEERDRERRREIEERERERVRELEERERERLREIEKEREREKQRERDRQRQLELERVQKREKEKEQKVIHVGYQMESPRYPEMRGNRDSREGTSDRKSKDGKSSRSSRSDDDYEGSAQNISSIKTAIPMQYDHKRPQEPPKKTDTKRKDKNKKKPSVKDRSKAYEYSYDQTYLGGSGSSRHASLENMNTQQYGYSPYAQMPGMGGYQTGRPTQQQMHWDQYRYPRSSQQPHHRGDYW